MPQDETHFRAYQRHLAAMLLVSRLLFCFSLALLIPIGIVWIGSDFLPIGDFELWGRTYEICQGSIYQQVSRDLYSGGSFVEWVIPPLTCASITLLLSRHLRRLILRRRQIDGYCLHCAYDLRMHKSGDRCPECGTLKM